MNKSEEFDYKTEYIKIRQELEMDNFILHQIERMNKFRSLAEGFVAINAMIRELGEFVQADRVYIIDKVGDIYENTYEWCAQGVEPQIDNLQELHFEDMPNWLEVFQEGKSVYITDVEDIRETMPVEYMHLTAVNAKTVIAIPMLISSKLMGFFGVENVGVDNSHIMFLMKSLASHLATVRENRRMYEAIEIQNQKLHISQKSLEMERAMFRDAIMSNSNFVFSMDTEIGDIKLSMDTSGELPQEAAVLVNTKKYDEFWPKAIEVYRPVFLRGTLSDIADCKALQECFKMGKRQIVVEYCFTTIQLYARETILISENPSTKHIMACVMIDYITDEINAQEEQQRKLSKANESLLKANRALEVQMEITKSLSDIYFSTYLIDLDRDYYRGITSRAQITTCSKDEGVASETLRIVNRSIVVPEDQKRMDRFINLYTLRERMKDERVISQEFKSPAHGWCRASFIVNKRDEAGILRQVLFVIRIIDSEKKKELDAQAEVERINRELQRALENNNIMYSEMLRLQEVGVVALNPRSMDLVFMNDAAQKMFDLKEDEYQTQGIENIRRFTTKGEKSEFLARVEMLHLPGEVIDFDCMLRYEDKQPMYVSVTVKQIELSSGRELVIATLTDISVRKEMEEELTYLSEIDGLTGISNRGSGEKQISLQLQFENPGMMCLLDCDHFKSINDNYGHAVGDQVLVALARTMRESFREDDILMRLGGDEFAFYLRGVFDRDEGLRRINEFFANVDQICIEDIKLSVSLGAVLYDGNEEMSFDELYHQADECLYMSKKQPGNCAQFYE